MNSKETNVNLEKNKLIPGVKNILPVASGKGGVGKSTVSANLALALARSGAKVGLMDADVYGPSIPAIMGMAEKPLMENNRIEPPKKYGIKVISMGFFMSANDAVIWRGPMLHKMVQDFLSVVDWGELDYLIVDLPPGTGDIHLSLCQTIPVTGAVIVSTPQDLSWNVAQKAILMFDKLNTPILGIIENMSHFVCNHCGATEEIFGSGAARRAAERLGIAYLGEIPIVTAIRKSADQGHPLVHSDPDSLISKDIIKIAENLLAQVSLRNAQGETRKVPVKISPPNAQEIQIEWNDGKKSVFQSKDLRIACPCAVCVNEFTGQRTLDPNSIAQDIRPLSISPVGRYALHIVWSDRHTTGLYGFEYLRKLSAGHVI